MSLYEKSAVMPAVSGFLASLLLLAGAAAAHLFLLPLPQALALYLASALLAGLTAGRWGGMVLSAAGAVAYALVGLRTGGGQAWGAASTLDAAAALLSLLLVSQLAAALQRVRERERQYRRTDPLTGVLNLWYFMERAESEMKRARRNRQPISIACLGIENAMETGDLLGLMHRDRLLKAFARDLRLHTRSSDIIARSRENEFIVFLPEAGLKRAQGAASKIYQIFRRAAEQEDCHATLCVGLVTVLNPELELEAAMKQASDLLLQAKSDGGGSIREETLG